MPVFKPLEDWDGAAGISDSGLCATQKVGGLVVKGYFDDGILHSLFSSDGGANFYNEAEPRLALNATRH